MPLVPSFRLTDLIHAVINGDLSTLLDNVTAANVNYTDPQYRLSLVMWAVTLGRLPTTELLLSRGASLAQVDRYGFTILHRAVWTADVPVLHMVLFTTPLSASAAAASPSAHGAHAHLSPSASLSSQSASPVPLTWRPGAQRLVNAVHAPTGRTPLMLAALCGHVDVVRFLLVTCAADPYPRDSHHLTAVDLAALCGHLHVVRLLLSLTVAPNGAGDGAADVFPTTQCGAEEYIEVAKTMPQRQRLCDVNRLLNENLAAASRVAAM
ncbi:Ankyrin repeats (3 copies)/Ankyrin repeats (many copies)/Ankyrin repeat [Novymonas esmeraldas]|uniref:Ankyrin repeats (3 copies)/Ankyrin repeats (Many copies)/Ankyrin repeat n=1 Tax=Novymonas esmeraldas TaxID=1808958 RepID=A0AAW0F1C2_9TRYP